MDFRKALVMVFLPIILFAGISVTSELTHEYYTETGKTISGKINVKNSGDKPEIMQAFIKDYLFYADGSNDYAEPGTKERSNANWIIISPQKATIDPKSSISIDYKINVPKNGDFNGSYWSMIMVEAIPEKTPESNKKSLGLSINTRFGIQIITNFGTNIEPEIKFIDTKLIDDGDKKYLKLDIENTGAITVRSEIKVEVYDMEGNFIELFEGDNKRTYPGTSVNLKCELSKLKKGKYKAIIMADCGNNNIFGANVNLEM